MPRIKITINKTNQQKIDRFIKWAAREWPSIDNEKLAQCFNEHMKYEIRSLRDCSEKMIVEHYIEYLKNDGSIDKTNTEKLCEYITSDLKGKVRTQLAAVYTNKTFDNNIDIYFNEVKRQYILHPQNESDEIIFCPENRDIFIKNNLKLVVNCAKRYQNLGLPFEDLIQAGNEGLLLAFDKFKADKANLRNQIIEDIDNTGKDSFSYDEVEKIIKTRFTYGKLLDQTLKKIPTDGFGTKQAFYDWCYENIKSAVFASVAFQWIRANIIIELSKTGSVIKMPKGTKNEDGESNTLKLIRLDSINPYTEDCYSDNELSVISNEEFMIEDQAIENVERQQTFIETVETLLSHLKPNEKRIIKKRFGIGYPYHLTIQEIAENEKISTNQVKKIIKESLLVLSESLTADQKEMLTEIL